MKCAGIAVGLASIATIVACGDSTDSDRPTVVTSTDVWGDIAVAIAGPDATARSLITDPDADPHPHEACAVESAELGDADLVVYNGGGYDEFAEKAVAGTNKRTVDAFSLR